MKLTKIHVNSLYVLTLCIIIASALALWGRECFATGVLAAGLGLAINFAEKPPG